MDVPRALYGGESAEVINTGEERMAARGTRQVGVLGGACGAWCTCLPYWGRCGQTSRVRSAACAMHRGRIARRTTCGGRLAGRRGVAACVPAPASAVRAGALWVEQAAGMGAKGGGWMSRFGRHEAGRPRRTGMDGVGKGRELMWGGSEGGSKTVLRRAWAETFRVYTANVGGAAHQREE